MMSYSGNIQEIVSTTETMLPFKGNLKLGWNWSVKHTKHCAQEFRIGKVIGTYPGCKDATRNLSF